MKNIVKIIVLFVFATGLLASCDKDSEGISSIVSYPAISLIGDNLIILNVGSGSFVDEGAVAFAGDESLPVTTIGSVDVSTMGLYSIIYSASVETEIGQIVSSIERKVLVVDKNHFASLYLGESEFGVRHYYNSPVWITDNGDGTYDIDDLAGGFYFYGRYPGYDAYGYDFKLEATLRLNPNNTISLVSLGHWYWDGNSMDITAATYDPATGVVDMTLDFAGDPFYVKLTK